MKLDILGDIFVVKNSPIDSTIAIYRKIVVEDVLVNPIANISYVIYSLTMCMYNKKSQCL